MAIEIDRFQVESERRLRALPRVIHRVHLLGVGGSAMTALAGMLVERGYHVSGSDTEVYEPAASLLKRMKVDVYRGFSPEHLTPPPDLVVIGNAITAANPEAKAVLERGIPFLSMPEAVRHFFLRDHKVIAVAGTHGKTTSSAMLAHVLRYCGRDPGAFIGGVALNFNSNWILGKGLEFVIEADEYDSAFFDKRPKFLHYNPWGVILTSVEFDHADIYSDLEAVKRAFQSLVTQLGSGHVLVVCADQSHALSVSETALARKITFGLFNGDYRAANIRIGKDGVSFDVTYNGNFLPVSFRLPIFGKMNVTNALGVIALARELELPEDKIAAALASFKGVARRQQIVAEVDGVVVVDDFAHHPTAVRVTLEALSERFPNCRLIVAFEPRSNTSRRRIFQEEYTSAFDRAAYVFLAPVYDKENDPLPAEQRLDVSTLARAIAARGPKAVAATSNDELLNGLAELVREGDVVVFMSNGPFGNLKDRLVDKLLARRISHKGASSGSSP